MHALGLEFGSAAQLSKRPGSVWNCLWGNALKRSPGIIRKSRVLYPGPGFLSSATWPSLPKKHYNGLNQTKPQSMNGSSTVHSLLSVLWSFMLFLDGHEIILICSLTYCNRLKYCIAFSSIVFCQSIWEMYRYIHYV